MSNSVFSDWQIYPIKSEKAGNMRANGKVVIAGTVRVDFKIMNGSKGEFATFPSTMVEKDGEKKYYPHVAIIDETTRETFQVEAMAAYQAQLAGKLPAVARTVPKVGKDVPF